MIRSFSIGGLPRIVFGDGSLERVPELTASFGRRVLLVTGRRSLRVSSRWPAFAEGLGDQGISWKALSVEGEPSPGIVDEAVTRFRRDGIDVVVGIGGGSALDAAKAIAGLLPHGNSVVDHLEGVGRGVPYEGPSLPFIAVPTTAGSGSEATKNAVLSERGKKGFKKSFRHDCLLARYAVVDPTLLESCSHELIASDGMDAITQLVESYVSLRSNPFTGALAASGLDAARDGLWEWYDGIRPAQGRSKMAYASLLSGIVLAQTGLGAVHGLASPLGAFFPIPHGAVCGTLLAAATDANIRALEDREPDNPALEGYARVARLLTGESHDDPRAARSALVRLLRQWTERLALPRLGRWGVAESDVASLVADSRGSSMKTNPIVLDDEELAAVLRERL